MNLKKMLKVIIKNGGLTYNPREKEVVTSGYCVGVKGFEKKVELSKVKKSHLKKYLKDVRSDLVLGCWVHEGNLYLDNTEIVKTEKEGIEKGKSRNELGIFHLDTFTEIML